MGLDWFLFRLKYELLKKFNFFDKLNEKILKRLQESDERSFFYQRVGLINQNFRADEFFVERANRAINGEIFSFSHEYLYYTKKGEIHWQMNPISKIEVRGDTAWNRLPDFGEYGDIKLIWEASRFPQVYFFINAYSMTQDEKYAHACIVQILHWIENNPYPYGLNYKCGQEITFRIFAWIMALEYFEAFIRKEDEEKIVKNIYTSLLRIDANIDYAAKSVKNNHSISEASGLFIGGLLFPQFKESAYFVERGLNYLLQETAYQVYADGSYIQHSFTYQRLALDLLSWILLLSEKRAFSLPQEIRERHGKMLSFLNAFIQDNGWLPNYGTNDGANFFPLTPDNYRDFRSSLNLASVLNQGGILFDDHLELIKFFDLEVKGTVVLKKENAFVDGGYYILKSEGLFAFIRAHSYRDRPAQNDMFHLDVWYQGKNIFCDAGSYSYNTDKAFKENFIGTKGHNTVVINHQNQMRQVLNFGWSNWIKTDIKRFDKEVFLAENYAYQKDFSMVHQREVICRENRIVIKDDVGENRKGYPIQQIWNTKYEIEIIDDYRVKIANCILSSECKYRVEESYISDYYNSYTKGKKVIFEFERSIETTMEFIG